MIERSDNQAEEILKSAKQLGSIRQAILAVCNGDKAEYGRYWQWLRVYMARHGYEIKGRDRTRIQKVRK